MNIIVKAKNIELVESVNYLVNQKLAPLGKFFKTDEGSKEMFVELKKDAKHHKNGDIFWVEVIMMLKGKKLVVTSKGETLAKAIVSAKDEMQIEIKKYKTKVVEEPRRKIKKALRKTEGR